MTKNPERNQKNQDKIFEQCNNSYGSFLHDFKYDKSAFEVPEKERTAFYEKLWNERGFALWLGNYSDLLTDEEANHTISEFVRDKIRSQGMIQSLQKTMSQRPRFWN